MSGEYDPSAPISDRMGFVLAEVEELEAYAAALVEVVLSTGFPHRLPSKPRLEAIPLEKLRRKLTLRKIISARKSKRLSRYRLAKDLRIRSRGEASSDLTLEELDLEAELISGQHTTDLSEEAIMADYKPDPEELSALAEKLGLEVPRSDEPIEGSASSVSEGREATDADILNAYEKELKDKGS